MKSKSHFLREKNVRRILNKRINGRKAEFLIQWKSLAAESPNMAMTSEETNLPSQAPTSSKSTTIYFRNVTWVSLSKLGNILPLVEAWEVDNATKNI